MNDKTREKIRHSRDSLFRRVNSQAQFLSYEYPSNNLWNIYTVVHFTLNEIIMRERKQNETINR